MEPLLTTNETAKLLKVSERQVRYLINSGRLKVVNLGLGGKRKSLRFRPEDVELLVSNSMAKEDPPRKRSTSKPVRRVNRY